ncbi:hypothetical protein VTN00DRAFT_2195 [Thermoascus crustaceus]|uniref:uncharacterized protein n=1 Tax=Thermoascus crustaceus TaxID=5088 RepID=UPI003743410A
MEKGQGHGRITVSLTLAQALSGRRVLPGGGCLLAFPVFPRGQDADRLCQLHPTAEADPVPGCRPSPRRLRESVLTLLTGCHPLLLPDPPPAAGIAAAGQPLAPRRRPCLSPLAAVPARLCSSISRSHRALSRWLCSIS